MDIFIHRVPAVFARLLAHGGAEKHALEETVDGGTIPPVFADPSILERLADLSWFVQIPLYVLTLAIIGAALWLVTKKIDTALMVVSFLMLVSSFFLYEAAPSVSILAITAGLLITMFVTFVGLSAGE